MVKNLADKPRLSLGLIDASALAILVKVAIYCKKHQIRAYLVGGFIRDTLLGRTVSDIDITVSQDVSVLGNSLAEYLSGKFVGLDKENKIGRIVWPEIADLHLDISAFTGTIENNLECRDFTINAMAVKLSDFITQKNAVLIQDYFQGCDDLDHNILRLVKGTAFLDDPLRLLRAIRLAAELGFRIEHKTESQIRKSAEMLRSIAGERIREELLALLDISRGGQYVKYADDLGLLAVIIPEINSTKGITQPPEHRWDVFKHTLMTINAVDYILGQGEWEYAQTRILTEVPWSEETADYFERPVNTGSTRRSLLKLAALLHDIAKPQTKTIEPNGKMRFIGHNEEGAEMVVKILTRLRFSARELSLVSGIVKYHLRPNQMGYPPSRRAVYRYFRDVGDASLDVLYFSLADHLATRGPGLILGHWIAHNQMIRHIIEEYSRQEKETKTVRLLDGNDLINIFALSPGPKMGEVLEAIKEAQATGELTDRAKAIDFVENLLLANNS